MLKKLIASGGIVLTATFFISLAKNLINPTTAVKLCGYNIDEYIAKSMTYLLYF